MKITVVYARPSRARPLRRLDPRVQARWPWAALVALLIVHAVLFRSWPEYRMAILFPWS